jgi:signal transduction histidine kinase
MKAKINPIFYVVTWLSLTLSLVGWWLFNSLRQLERLARFEGELASHLLRQQRMFYWEGLTFFILLILGGGALLYYVLRERERNSRVREFFATLTHELKTPLASLRLQAESLLEDLGGSSSKLIERLVGDTVRLELQLENALFLAGSRTPSSLHLEEIDLKEVFESLKNQWPELVINIDSKVAVKADERALDGILKNLLQNARVHGKASKIKIDALTTAIDQKVCIRVSDDGSGFKGEIKNLGKLFSRPTSKSGSGVGLYLSKNLAERMNGKLEFSQTPLSSSGFVVNLWLEIARKQVV